MADLNNPRIVEAARSAAQGQRGPLDWSRVVRRRVALLGVLFLGWAVGIEARLVYLQVVQHERLLVLAENQQHRTVPISAKRGDLVDRHGRLLAYSIDGDVIYADPAEILDPEATAGALCRALEGCSPGELDGLRQRLAKRGRFQYVRRRASPADVERVAALGLDGIGFLKENRRFYPNRELAGHVLGYVGVDNEGLSGVEFAYDAEIRGRPGRVLIHRDNRRRTLYSQIQQAPTAGARLALTLDEYLQFVTERALEEGVRRHRAAGGMAVVMDPVSGEILAMASRPTFNPNVFGRYPATDRRNRAVQDVFEPGSMAKIVTAAAAFEEQVVGVSDPIDVSAGYIRIGSRPPIRDVYRYGVLSFHDVVVKSSNVGIIKVGLRLGPERLDRWVRRFGFGESTSRDFPGEERGMLTSVGRLNDSAIASISMGYQFAVTPLQMAAAVSSVANGGELVEPRLVQAFIRGAHREETGRRVRRRTVRAESAQAIRHMMEDVVERGTARAAKLPGYRIAAKTGTAAKLAGGRYSKSDYNASIVGFVPSVDPVASIVVVIDTPSAGAIYGGAVAAPVFKDIAEAVLRYHGVPRSIDREAPVVVAARPAPGGRSADGPATRTAVFDSAPPAVPPVRGLMPDLGGLGAREAVHILARLGLAASLSGDGRVVSQSIPAGSLVERGGVCALRLSRQRPGGPAGEARP